MTPDQTIATRARPRGELLVEVYRPPMRFGLALSIAIRTDDGFISKGVILDDGNLGWVSVDHNVQSTPTMYLDEDVADAMYRALAQNPRPTTPQDRVYDHLADTMKQRDRVMDLLENTLERQHTTDLKVLDLT